MINFILSFYYSICQIGFQEFAFQLVCQASYPLISIQTVFRFVCNKVHSIFIEHAFSDNSNLFPIGRTSEESKVLGISADIRIVFSLGNMFCSNKITLAFRWRYCVNNRDTTGLFVASAIKSSRMMTLLHWGLISRRSSEILGTPLSKRMLFPADVFKSS